MSKAEILAELPRLRADELAEVQAKLDELTGETWQDNGELTDLDKTVLDAALAEYGKHPAASWSGVSRTGYSSSSSRRELSFFACSTQRATIAHGKMLSRRPENATVDCSI